MGRASPASSKVEYFPYSTSGVGPVQLAVPTSALLWDLGIFQCNIPHYPRDAEQILPSPLLPMELGELGDLEGGKGGAVPVTRGHKGCKK